MRSTNTFYIVVLWTATANIAKRGQIFGQVLEKQKPTQMDKGPVDRIIACPRQVLSASSVQGLCAINSRKPCQGLTVAHLQRLGRNGHAVPTSCVSARRHGGKWRLQRDMLQLTLC